MSLKAFSQPWADSLKNILNTEPSYAEAGRRWRWPLALVCDAEPQYGVPDAIGVELDLHEGRCDRAESKPGDAATAAFVLRAPYHTWKSIVKGELDPVGAVIQGKLKLAKGSLMTLMTHVASARALVECASKVDTEFPDEVARGK